MDLECLVWKTNPLYWQMVAGIKVGKGTLGITDRSTCNAKGKEIANSFGIGNFVSNSMIKCACKKVFSGDAPHVPVWHNAENLGKPMNSSLRGEMGAVSVPNTDITDLYVMGLTSSSGKSTGQMDNGVTGFPLTPVL